MSRTYRKYPKYKYIFRGEIFDDFDEAYDYAREISKSDRKSNFHKTWSRDLTWAWSIAKKGRDKKPWYKPNREFKQMQRQGERSRVKQAVRMGKEPPIFKKTDVWDWT